MHTWGYLYYSSENLGIHFCYQNDSFSTLSFEESGNKLIFNYSLLDWTINHSSLEIIKKDPKTSLSMYLSSKFVGSTCTQSCNKNESWAEVCTIMAPNSDFIDQSGLVSYHGTCPAQYIANQMYRSFTVFPSHPDIIIFNDQVGGDRGPLGVVESLNFN